MALEIPNATPVIYKIEFDGPNRKVISREVMKVTDHPLPPPPPDANKSADKAPEQPAEVKK